MFWMWIAFAGCGSHCPQTDMATVACPDGTCVVDLADCSTCPAGWSRCEASGPCVEDEASCESTDTAASAR